MINFAKMNGIGNKIIVADMRQSTDKITPQAAIALAANRDTGFDQIMAIHAPKDTKNDYYIAIINSDGSLAKACGNGTRCVVDFLHQDCGKNDFSFETDGGQVSAHYLGDHQIAVDMGEPIFDWRKIPLAHDVGDLTQIDLHYEDLHNPSIVSIGNPHAVFFVEKDVYDYPLERYGPILEHDPLFPEQANITIARVTSPTTIDQRTWERGAGLTLACGTAACATAVSAIRRGLTERKVRITLPGGALHIDWQDDNHIIMTGSADYEFSGKLDPQTGQWQKV